MHLQKYIVPGMMVLLQKNDKHQICLYNAIVSEPDAIEQVRQARGQQNGHSSKQPRVTTVATVLTLLLEPVQFFNSIKH